MDEPAQADLDEFDARITQRATEFERDWLARAAAQEKRRDQRSRRTTRQFWFLFVFLFASFILLAYRTEVVSGALRNGLYDACQSRAAQAQLFNEGREALIKRAINNPEDPIPVEQQPEVIEQLRAALLLPVEDCGPHPSA